MNFNAKWIRPKIDLKDVCPVFKKNWETDQEVKTAELYVTALGVYEARINGKRVGQYVLAPGWTAYQKRLQYQKYDITDLIKEKNELFVTVGKGWFRSPMPGWLDSEDKQKRIKQTSGLFAEIHLTYVDGRKKIICSDQNWEVGESAVRFSEIYDGEVYDASFQTDIWEKAEVFDWPKEILIPQEGEEIREKGRVKVKDIIVTPSGETVIDFGQNITGYIEISLEAKKGERIHFKHGEVLDKDGNFYNENYRSAKAEVTYICKEGKQKWHPKLTFFGFRYIKVLEYPKTLKLDQVTAVVVYSDIKQTGNIISSNADINKLISNVFWGQKGNFLDVPTDCPQRDERLGWTGDAQVFVKAASYNYDVEKFFGKWMRDLATDQRADGSVGQVIPDYLPDERESAAWGDAAVICPWQIYLTYGNKSVLEEQFSSMKKWVDYITHSTMEESLWVGGEHFGDWLGLDAPSGSYKGATREDFIASAFYLYSTYLLIKAGKVLGNTMEEYIKLYKNIKKKFRKTYTQYFTQTECVLAIWFGIADNPDATVNRLVEMIRNAGNQIQTGFVGTPYILHVLSNYGYTELAYTLLLKKEYPSWLYAVEKGATTIWEHWDGIMQNGDFWSADMNSFNHYAYGAVIDWIYEEAAGIKTVEANPGFEIIKIEPKPDHRLQWLNASIETKNGTVKSGWTYIEERIRYEITTPVPTNIIIDKKSIWVEPGEYVFWNTCFIDDNGGENG